MKLSDRLQMIANEINKGETMADIGTDHGFLPFYLVEQGICPKAVLCDVSKGSLQKGRDNVTEFWGDREQKLEEQFDFRLGDGLAVLEPCEVDAVVIAGMGGVLMTEIIGASLEKSKSFSRFILQPRNGQGKLRFWLSQNGFVISKEMLVREGKYICEILVAEPKLGEAFSSETVDNDGKEAEEDAIEFEIPERLIRENGCLGQEFLEYRLSVEVGIRENMKQAKMVDEEKLLRAYQRCRYLEGLK